MYNFWPGQAKYHHSIENQSQQSYQVSNLQHHSTAHAFFSAAGIGLCSNVSVGTHHPSARFSHVFTNFRWKFTTFYAKHFPKWTSIQWNPCTQPSKRHLAIHRQNEPCLLHWFHLFFCEWQWILKMIFLNVDQTWSFETQAETSREMTRGKCSKLKRWTQHRQSIRKCHGARQSTTSALMVLDWGPAGLSESVHSLFWTIHQQTASCAWQLINHRMSREVPFLFNGGNMHPGFANSTGPCAISQNLTKMFSCCPSLLSIKWWLLGLH